MARALALARQNFTSGHVARRDTASLQFRSDLVRGPLHHLAHGGLAHSSSSSDVRIGLTVRIRFENLLLRLCERRQLCLKNQADARSASSRGDASSETRLFLAESLSASGSLLAGASRAVISTPRLFAVLKTFRRWFLTTIEAKPASAIQRVLLVWSRS